MVPKPIGERRGIDLRGPAQRAAEEREFRQLEENIRKYPTTTPDYDKRRYAQLKNRLGR